MSEFRFQSSSLSLGLSLSAEVNFCFVATTVIRPKVAVHVAFDCLVQEAERELAHAITPDPDPASFLRFHEDQALEVFEAVCEAVEA